MSMMGFPVQVKLNYIPLENYKVGNTHKKCTHLFDSTNFTSALQNVFMKRQHYVQFVQRNSQTDFTKHSQYVKLNTQSVNKQNCALNEKINR